MSKLLFDLPELNAHEDVGGNWKVRRRFEVSDSHAIAPHSMARFQS